MLSGTSANDVHYQAYLLEGLYRWNQDRATQAVDGRTTYCHTYSSLLRHSVNQLSEKVLGNPLDHSFKAPRAYTGELIGVEYLYAQTGRALQTVLEENEEEEEKETEDQPDQDEGFVDDMTIPEARSNPSHHGLPISDQATADTLTDVNSIPSTSTTFTTQSIPSTSSQMVPATVPLEHTVSTTPTASSVAPPVMATEITCTNELPLEPVSSFEN